MDQLKLQPGVFAIEKTYTVVNKLEQNDGSGTL